MAKSAGSVAGDVYLDRSLGFVAGLRFNGK
jgi:hypothetical protein